MREGGNRGDLRWGCGNGCAIWVALGYSPPHGISCPGGIRSKVYLILVSGVWGGGFGGVR